MNTITKSQFENAYLQFPPSRCEAFYLKNCSISSLDIKTLPATIITLGLIGPFLFGLGAYIFHWPLIFIHIPTFIYIGILAIIGLVTFRIWRKRFKRIGNICKTLGVTRKEYRELVNKYYYENYYPDIKDYINNLIEEI